MGTTSCPASHRLAGTVSTETYPGIDLRGGFTILALPDHAAAREWARKIAVACGCSQEVREFMDDAGC